MFVGLGTSPDARTSTTSSSMPCRRMSKLLRHQNKPSLSNGYDVRLLQSRDLESGGCEFDPHRGLFVLVPMLNFSVFMLEKEEAAYNHS